MFTFPKALALAALISSIYAGPVSVPTLTSIPPNAVRVAHDSESNVLIAYDANGQIIGQIPVQNAPRFMERQAPGSCVNMSPSDVQNLPGWNQISDYIVNTWGSGWDTIDANPSDYPSMGAQLCTTGSPSLVTISGQPNCNNQTESSGGTLVGAGGSVALSATQGTSQTTEITVTQASSLAVGASVSAEVSVPDIADFTATITSTVTITNTLSTANTVTNSDQQTQTITIQAQAGQTCQLTFNVESCQFTGTGSLTMVANGWVWVYYGYQVDGHYKWAVNIQSLLTDPNDYSTSIGFSAGTSSSTAAQFDSVCQ